MPNPQKELLTPSLLSSFRPMKIFKDLQNSVTAVDWDDEGKFVAACSAAGTLKLLEKTNKTDETIKIYSAESGKLHNTVQSCKYGVDLPVFTHISTAMLYASTKIDDSLRYISLHDNSFICYFPGHEARVKELKMSPVDDNFMSACSKTVRMWDLRNKKCTGIVEIGVSMSDYDDDNMNGPLLAYDPSGRVFALGLPNSTLRLYNLQSEGSGPFITKFILDPLTNIQPAWLSMSFSNDGKFILISTENGLLVVDAFSLDLKHRLASKGKAMFSPDAKYILCGSMDGVECWNVKDGLQVGKLASKTAVGLVSFSPRSLIFGTSNTKNGEFTFWTPSF